MRSCSCHCHCVHGRHRLRGESSLDVYTGSQLARIAAPSTAARPPSQLNGSCQAGACRCFPGWAGQTCDKLKPEPAPAMTAGSADYALYPMKRPLPPRHEGTAAAAAAAVRGVNLTLGKDALSLTDPSWTFPAVDWPVNLHPGPARP